MKQNYEFAFRHVIGHEGGFTDSRHDRGNWTSGTIGQGELKGTKYGISAMAYPTLDIRNLSLKAAKQIYKADYWDACRCDELPLGIDYMVFDTAVNQGVRDAVKFLQFAGGSAADGIFGPKTMTAVDRTEPEDLLTEFAARRMYDYMLLDSIDDRYGLGWSRRIVDATLVAYAQITDG